MTLFSRKASAAYFEASPRFFIVVKTMSLSFFSSTETKPFQIEKLLHQETFWSSGDLFSKTRASAETQHNEIFTILQFIRSIIWKESTNFNCFQNNVFILPEGIRYKVLRNPPLTQLSKEINVYYISNLIFNILVRFIIWNILINYPFLIYTKGEVCFDRRFFPRLSKKVQLVMC